MTLDFAPLCAVSARSQGTPVASTRLKAQLAQSPRFTARNWAFLVSAQSFWQVSGQYFHLQGFESSLDSLADLYRLEQVSISLTGSA